VIATYNIDIGHREASGKEMGKGQKATSIAAREAQSKNRRELEHRKGSSLIMKNEK
jgi:hypothetical protein